MKRKQSYQLVKVGTMPRAMVLVTIPDGGFKVGKSIQFREELSGRKWTEARIWQIGAPPEYMLFLENRTEYEKTQESV